MTNNFPLTLLYDGQCPVCKLEMDNFRHRDLRQISSGQAQRLVFVDISQAGFNATAYGASLAQMQALIHAVRPDGSLVVGVPALRLAYQAVGLGAWAAPTGWPLLALVFGWAYSWFARNRYRFSGVLMPLIAHVAQNRAAKRAVTRARACADGVCGVARPHPSPLPEGEGEGVGVKSRSSSILMQKEHFALVKPAQAAIKSEADYVINPQRSVV